MRFNILIYIMSFMTILVSFTGISHAQAPSDDLLEGQILESVDNNLVENPCPNPRMALENTPNDLQIIQEDITRFNLCLQRAQLLSRLNALAEENSDTINSSLDAKLETIAGDFQPEPMPMPEIPQIPQSEIAPVDAPSMPMQPIAEPIPPKDHTRWFVDAIKGKNGVLIATLIDSDGNVTHVKNGTTIPDTKVRITSVSQTSVTVMEDKESIKLKWKQ